MSSKRAWLNALFTVLFLSLPINATAQDAGFQQGLLQASANSPAIAEFYQNHEFAPLWTGNSNKTRWRALMDALGNASAQGLPTASYNAAALASAYDRARSPSERGAFEIQASQAFLKYASDVQSGVVNPVTIDPNMTLVPPRRGQRNLLDAFSKSTPSAFMAALEPRNPDYPRLLNEKIRIEQVIASGGWGAKVSARALKPGDSGPQVAAMRARLLAMGYGSAGSGTQYDAALEHAVAQFQTDNGLNNDGVAGTFTLNAINTSPKQRLVQVVVGLERLRWLNKPLGRRYIMVNEADFTATVIDGGKPVFSTRVVIGKPGRWRTPEFEQMMTHLIINPSWFVPGSIAGGEYLPQLLSNPGVLDRQGIVMTNTAGVVVDPTTVDFTQYSKTNFPFSLRQPPGDDNALGMVKFMFPNRFSIYLHDTPAKALFAKDIRTYSHGCVRLQDPTGLANVLLGAQSADPQAMFDAYVAAGVEATVGLQQPVPIYLVYRTAIVGPNNQVAYRTDAYDVDQKVFAALSKAGVSLGAAGN